MTLAALACLLSFFLAATVAQAATPRGGETREDFNALCEVMLSAAGAKAEALALKARVTEIASKLRAAAQEWEEAGTNMSAFTSAAQAVENRTNAIAEEIKALEEQLLFGKKDSAAAETIDGLAAKMAPNSGSSGNKGFAVARNDEIVALANDMMWLCNLFGGDGNTGCGKSSDGVCACAYKGATAASKSGWHGMKASGSGASPAQIKDNNWPITKGICDTRSKEGAKQNAEDISTHMIAALATLRPRLSPGKPPLKTLRTHTASDKLAKRDAAPQAPNRKHASATQKKPRKKQAACPAGHPLQWRSPHACERPPNWKARSARSAKRHTFRAADTQAMAPTLGNTREGWGSDFARHQRKKHSDQPPSKPQHREHTK
ncbi:hypothetical protein ERJ75_001113300 [Trypanosoma vivax]|uniref:Uncharacterized protein n=1 Tax=Trypanosoma vivax (strain Y486) TaxID=1055687 RepID=F9WSM2_TRYVY|nr:hypothetical protein ERJ75_001113300 [Trypanosoma vivax]CCD20561.1 hypothetical protein, conserved in T.vivax [Trypanosoma vivax Y486]|eukprot:CCD20561.1 hypothetical protein, conserved in T.vivax [Trypanosoma vivax Y486]